MRRRRVYADESFFLATLCCIFLYIPLHQYNMRKSEFFVTKNLRESLWSLYKIIYYIIFCDCHLKLLNLVIYILLDYFVMIILLAWMEKHLGTLHKNINPTLFISKSRRYRYGYFRYYNLYRYMFLHIPKKNNICATHNIQCVVSCVYVFNEMNLFFLTLCIFL